MIWSQSRGKVYFIYCLFLMFICCRPRILIVSVIFHTPPRLVLLGSNIIMALPAVAGVYYFAHFLLVLLLLLLLL